MGETHNVKQGSDAWHAMRAQHFTASEAPAMMGGSRWQSRSELLRQKATGSAPDVDADTQRRFDAGHAAEAAARPLAEAIIGDDLYPVTCTDDVDGLALLASLDGMTMTPARRRVFCASLGDVFDNEVPAEWRADLFDLILATPHLDWLLLTKRIGNAKKMLNEVAVCRGALLTANDEYRPPENVWIGATICNQAEADRDIPKLLAVPARVRFLSIEPMLGPISMRWLPAFPENAPHIAQRANGETNHLDGLRRLDWIIVGGESGQHARPMQAEWVRTLRGQCVVAGVPFLFKRWERFNEETRLYERGTNPFVWYRADGDQPDIGNGALNPERWRPSIHMPRAASRILLEIVGVRVERLQDISYEDAIAEGMFNPAKCPPFPHRTNETPEEYGRRTGYPQRDYAELWEKLNGAGAWSANPWVWCVEFRRVTP